MNTSLIFMCFQVNTITLSFNAPLCNVMGNDFTVMEISHGNPVFANYPEQAEVSVSQDGEIWYSLGLTGTSDPEIDCLQRFVSTSFDFNSTSLSWIQYIRITDVTNPWAFKRNLTTCSETDYYAFNSAADGFDVNGVTWSVKPIQYSSPDVLAKSNQYVELDSKRNSARIFPNPVEEKISINLDEEVEMVLTDDHLTLEIVDVMGKKWITDKLQIDDTWKIERDVPNLSPGLYIACVTTGNVKRYYKFLKK
jgi:hypothetical protein